MDRYRASIDGVDSALNRLNQTMAAYQISKTKGHEDAQGDTNEQSQTSSDRLGGVHQEIKNLRGTLQQPERISDALRVEKLHEAFALLTDSPYCLVTHLFIAAQYLALGYPDLAAGSAYKALLLSDALDDEAEEYHDEALEALAKIIAVQPLQERIELLRQAVDKKDEAAWSSEPEPELDVEIFHWLEVHYRPLLYRILVHGLIECGSFRSAYSYLQQALRVYPHDVEFQTQREDLKKTVAETVKDAGILDSPPEWPDRGFVRRELYPWNDHEPDRLNDLSVLNSMMQEVAPKLEVRAVQLPALADSFTPSDTVTQLGVFAREDLAPGQVILDETSLLTANNRLQDALCDACSTDLPDLSSPAAAAVVSCPECDVVFCTPACLSAATETYHPALCDKDVEAIAKDVAPSEAADALYSLLLLRAFAMAETQGLHPLKLREVKYIWGDFSPSPSPSAPSHSSPSSPPSTLLPFTFDHNIRLPLHMLEKMDVDVFAHPAAEVWVFNTLYAKFRGTASARLSGAGGGPVRGPEVGAVHPMWCLANHGCDPNVRWDWGGSVRFEVRRERVEWGEKGARGAGGGEEGKRSLSGIRKGEEVVNHYCDVELPVGERREWARGALGGDCRCERCKWEAGEMD